MYELTITVADGTSDGTDGDQYVTINGTGGTTEESLCDGTFSSGSTTSCTVTSVVDVGEVTCVVWRTVGTDGWLFQKVGNNYFLLVVI